jgi:threonine/homoserine/homoserine lactone efflux protein
VTNEQLFPFAIASVMVILAPGPDILMVVARGMSQGRRAGIAAALGFTSGLVVHIALVAYGFAWLLQRHPSAASGIKWVGGIYIGYLAWRLWWAKRISFNTDAPDQRKEFSSIYFQSVLLNVLNPKVALFFLFFLPHFVARESTTARLDIMLLGGMFMLLTVSIFGTCAIVAGTLGDILRKRPGLARWLTRSLSLVFFALAIWMIRT